MNDPVDKLRHTMPEDRGDLASIWHKTEAGIISGARPDRQLGGRGTKVAGVLVAVAVVAAVAVVGLRAANLNLGDGGLAATPDAVATTSLNTASPSPTGNTATSPAPQTNNTIEIATETDSLSDPTPLDRSIERPVLMGVAPEVAEGFNIVFDSYLNHWTDWTENVNLANSAEYAPFDCNAAIRDGFLVAQLVATTTVGMYGNFATATTLWEPILGCSEGAIEATSITMNIDTGELIPLEYFTNGLSEVFVNALKQVAHERCSEPFDDQFYQNTPQFQAWSPMTQGLVFTWGQQTAVWPDNCGSPGDMVITIGWDEPLMPSNPSPFGLPEWAQVPDGLDSRVGGPVPVPTVRLTRPASTVDQSLPDLGFVLPSGNIYCDIGLDYVFCGANETSFEPAPIWGGHDGAFDGSQVYLGGSWTIMGMAGQPAVRAALDRGENISTLEYGQAVVVGTVACVSQEIGLTCWDLASNSGFWYSKENYSVWNWTDARANQTSLGGGNSPSQPNQPEDDGSYDGDMLVESILWDADTEEWVTTGRKATAVGTYPSGATEYELGEEISFGLPKEALVLGVEDEWVTIVRMEYLFYVDYEGYEIYFSFAFRTFFISE